MDASTSRDRKLPLVYVVDSILKNVKGEYKSIIEKDAKNWIPVVFDVLTNDQRAKLKKVWNLWRPIFSDSVWREMGSPFLTNAGVAKLAASANNKDDVGGISRSADGTLQLKPAIRKHMQAELDGAQQDVSNELDKVSLERLADINPDLLVKLKENAQRVLAAGGGSASATSSAPSSHQNKDNGSSTPNFFAETRPPYILERSKAWKEHTFDYEKEVPQICIDLESEVQSILTSEDARYTQTEAIQMQNTLAAASVVAAHLTKALEGTMSNDNGGKASGGLSTRAPTRRFLIIDRKLFTNDGIKKKDPTVIGSLYELGLPFISKSDGRRFASQLELSKHLDYLFKKNQLEKSMQRTEERGWYLAEDMWIRKDAPPSTSSTAAGAATGSTAAPGGAASAPGPSTEDGDRDPNTYREPADESRDPCVVCGINFKMELDNDEGIFKFINCREIEVLNDDVAEVESENKLVHVTCWRGLGKPEWLTSDQALQGHSQT